MNELKKIAFVMLLVLIVAGCDPGWHYGTHGMGGNQDHGEPMWRSSDQSVEGRARASLFSMGLTVEVEIVNRGSSSVSVDPKLLRVLDAKGMELSREWVSCAGA
ncbi:MAG TPA: hypothetical protein VLW86_00005, partial [Syntrophorhabdales bacterium]|nr:hypothetical protein [Syntrophorhabdales bacterium]